MNVKVTVIAYSSKRAPVSRKEAITSDAIHTTTILMRTKRYFKKTRIYLPLCLKDITFSPSTCHA